MTRGVTDSSAPASPALPVAAAPAPEVVETAPAAPQSGASIGVDGGGAFDLITEIDSGIAERADPDFYAQFVMRYSEPEVAEAINGAAIATIQNELRGNPDFPGFNAPHASEWLGEFHERLEFHRLTAPERVRAPITEGVPVVPATA